MEEPGPAAARQGLRPSAGSTALAHHPAPGSTVRSPPGYSSCTAAFPGFFPTLCIPDSPSVHPSSALSAVIPFASTPNILGSSRPSALTHARPAFRPTIWLTLLRTLSTFLAPHNRLCRRLVGTTDARSRPSTHTGRDLSASRAAGSTPRKRVTAHIWACGHSCVVFLVSGWHSSPLNFASSKCRRKETLAALSCKYLFCSEKGEQTETEP